MTSNSHKRSKSYLARSILHRDKSKGSGGVADDDSDRNSDTMSTSSIAESSQQTPRKSSLSLNRIRSTRKTASPTTEPPADSPSVSGDVAGGGGGVESPEKAGSIKNEDPATTI